LAEERQSKFDVEPLGDHHRRAAFSCGVEQLDRYMHKQAMQDLKRHAAVPFVLTDDGNTIAGYYTLSQFAVELDTVPEDVAKRLPRYPMVSTTLLGRLAVSQSYRGLGLGEMLLMDALRRSLHMSRQIASAAVVVDAIDEVAVSFYKKYSFIELPKIGRRLFLPMKTIQQTFG
jgi:predicted GNAT family N-acyltransferase